MKILVTENQFKKLINLITEDGDKTNVMFVGDSLSAGPGFTWNYLLAKDHPDWNSTHITKGGMKTDWMLNNMLAELNKKKYDKVFIYGGTNNAFWVGTNISQAVSDIQKMVDATKKQGGQAYVFLGYDAASVMTDKNLKPTKDKYGKSLCDKNCMEKSRERMIKLQNDLASQISGAVIIPTIVGDESWASGDGIHVGSSQQKIMKDHISKYIGEKTSIKKDENQITGQDMKKELDDFFKNYFKFLSKKKIVDEKSNKNDIKRMQIVLILVNKKGSPDKIKGVFDEETKNQVLAFQRENNLKETGYFDIETQKELTNKLFPGTQTSKNNEPTKDSQTVTDSSAKLRQIPGDIEQQFKNIPGVDFNKFKSDVESIGLPLKYAIRQLYTESAFLPNVISCKKVSTAGAKGIAQFMPTTWPTYGKGGDPCKPSDALPAYVKLMKELINRFNGRLDLVFAGYNSGPNYKFGSGPNKGKMVYDYALKNNIPITKLKGKIPEETYNYSLSILQP